MTLALLAAPSVGKSSPPIFLIPICLFIMLVAGLQAAKPDALRNLSRYQYKDRESPPQLSPGFLVYQRIIGGIAFAGATAGLIFAITKL